MELQSGPRVLSETFREKSSDLAILALDPAMLPTCCSLTFELSAPNSKLVLDGPMMLLTTFIGDHALER